MAKTNGISPKVAVLCNIAVTIDSAYYISRILATYLYVVTIARHLFGT